jgi:twinkle protein
MEKRKGRCAVNEVIKFPKSKQGCFPLWDLPQRVSLEDDVYGTGWPQLDRIFKFYPGQLVVLTGLAGHGKSTLALNLICNLAVEQDLTAFLYVPENETGLVKKMRRLWQGSQDGFEYFAKYCCAVQSANRDYCEEPHTMDWILAQAHKEFELYEPATRQIVLIDPWNELDRAKPKDMLLTDYIGWCLMQIKDFVRSTQRTVIVIAHPTKAVAENGGRTPTLADIEGSMNWYNKCDNGLVIVREQLSTKIISAKVREEPYAGRRGECRFYVDPNTGIFTPQGADDDEG